MTIDLTGLVRPHLVEMTKRDDNPNAAEFRLQPLERGFGYTLGNSLRRLLLSSLRGTAVWGFRLDGVVHEHQTVQGVLEDVHQVVQRLKSLTLVLAEDVDEAILHIRREGAGPVYARDIQEHGSVSVKNPDHLLFTLQDDREVSMELYVNKGRGYVEAEMHPADRVAAGGSGAHRRDLQSGPPRQLRGGRDPRRPAHRLRPAHGPGRDQRHDHAGRRDRLRGRARPRSTSSTSWTSARCPRCGTPAPHRPRRVAPTSAQRLARPIDDFGLSVRSLNSLKNSNIRTLKDLVEFSEDDLLKVKNVGEKALSEIAELLQREGLNFGMGFEETDGELRIARPGVAAGGPALRRHRGGLMRHRAKGRQLSRTSSHKRALLNNMASSLFEHGRVVTTEAKAKELRPFAEKLITLARRGDLHARRLVERRIKDRDTLGKLFSEIGPRFAARPGGYTRILKLGHRPGDGADIARIELLSE